MISRKHKHDRKKKTINIFKQLNESLRKYLKEEEMLYSKCKRKTGKILPILQTIRREHLIFLENLDKIRNSLKGTDKIDTSGFYTLLERHKNIEERLLYPELDNVLSDKEKEDVYWKIKAK